MPTYSFTVANAGTLSIYFISKTPSLKIMSMSLSNFFVLTFECLSMMPSIVSTFSITPLHSNLIKDLSLSDNVMLSTLCSNSSFNNFLLKKTSYSTLNDINLIFKFVSCINFFFLNYLL